jgi:hypothetical protein
VPGGVVVVGEVFLSTSLATCDGPEPVRESV